MKKNFITGFVSGAVIFSMIGALAATYTANDNPFPIKLNGKDVSIEGYNINDYTYFKLRDIADAVGGFDVDFKDSVIELTKKNDAADKGAIQIAEQGIFSSGGTVTEPVAGEFDYTTNWLDPTRAGNTAHVDHANVLYQQAKTAAEGLGTQHTFTVNF